MSEYYVDIRLTFRGEFDEWDPEYESIDISHVEQLSSNLPEKYVHGMIEALSQSDFAYLGLPVAVIDAIQGGKHEVDKRMY